MKMLNLPETFLLSLAFLGLPAIISLIVCNAPPWLWTFSLAWYFLLAMAIVEMQDA